MTQYTIGSLEWRLDSHKIFEKMVKTGQLPSWFKEVHRCELCS